MKIKYFNFLMAILLLFGFSISSAMAEECTGPGGGTGGVGQPGRWVTIAADSNPNDSRTGYGRVTYEYSMLERPVTVAEYVTFLNAVDPDGNGNFEGALVQYELVGYSGGQWRTLAYTGCNPSVSQSFTAAQTGEMLISLVSMNQAARYANWVATGNINQGAYRFASTSANAGNSNIISIDSTYQGIRLPNENEYYKAAYWDPIARVYNRYGTTSLDGSGDAITGAPGSTGIISSTKHPFPFDYGTDGRGNCMVYVRSGQGGRSAYGISNLVGGFHDMMHPNNFGTGNMVLRPDNQFSNSAVSGTGDGLGVFPYEHQRSTWRWDGVPIDTFYSSPSFRLVQSPSACSLGSLTVTKAVTGKPSGFSSPNFPITVNCDGTAYDQTFNLQDGGSKTISNIPEGTSCTITEGTLPTPPTGYVYGTPVITPSTISIVGATTSTVAITNPLQTACAINAFTITPSCNNNGTAGTAADDYRTFTLNLSGTGVAATYNLSSNNSGVLTPTSGSYGTATNFRLQNASAGNSITYTLTATDATSSSCTRTATVSDTGSCSPTGTLRVRKTVTNPPAGFSSPNFNIAVDCSNDTFDQNFTLAHSATRDITGIPAGTTCSVTETTPLPTAPAGYEYGTPAIAPSGAQTIVANTTTEVVVTNPLNSVSCPTITVTPNPLPNGTVGVAYNASLSASASSGGPYTYTWSAVGLPTGMSVNAGSGAVSGTPGATGNATVTASTTVAGQTCSGSTPLSVAAAPTGSLSVTKAVTGKPVGFSSPNFSVVVDCSVDSFDQTLTVADDHIATINSIPTGTTCTVTEPTVPAAPAGYDYGTPVITPSGEQTISTGTTIAVTVTNPLTLKKGSLQLGKSVSGQPAGFTSPDYTLHVDCSDNSFDQDVLIKAAENKTISNIPHGTTCTVTEPTQPAPPAGYSYGTAVIAPASVTIVGDSSVSVSVLNPLEGNCTINAPTVTTQCYSNGTSSTADDTFGFRINTSGTFVAPTYDIQAGTLAVQDVPYGVDAGTYGDFLISGGAVNATLTDSNKAACQLNNVALTPPAPCSAPPPTCATVTNKAKVSALTGTDQNPGNDEDGVSLGANCATPPQIDLELVKTASVNTIKRGDTLVYTLTLTNKGPDDANDVQVKDLLPAGLSYVSSQAERGSYDATSGIWLVGKVANGVPVKLKITVRAD